MRVGVGEYAIIFVHPADGCTSCRDPLSINRNLEHVLTYSSYFARRTPKGAAIALAFLTACSACDSARPVEPDASAPVLRVTFPTSTEYDRNGDALVDFEVSWSDMLGEVDTASFRVRSLNGLNGTFNDSINVLAGWKVTRRDNEGIVFSETLANLLHGGLNRIEMSVRDVAGNIAVDTVTLELPHGAFYDSIPSQIVNTGSSHARGVVVCPDDRRVYATIGRHLVVIDADSLTIIGAYTTPAVMDQQNLPFCIPGEDILYVTYAVGRFSRSGLHWLPEVRPGFASFGIDQSRSDPNILFVGEYERIGIVDRAQAARIGSIDIARDSIADDEVYVDLASHPNGRKLYATRRRGGGILVVEPQTGNVLSVIDLEPQLEETPGRSDGIELSPDGRRLYVALLDAVPRGLLEIDTDTDKPLRRIGMANEVPQELAVSPSGQRIFVTTQDRRDIPSVNVLVDVASFQVIKEFPRPRAPGTIRIDGGVAFHPNGKLIFVGRDMTIDVYLNRE